MVRNRRYAKWFFVKGSRWQVAESNRRRTKKPEANSYEVGLEWLLSPTPGGCRGMNRERATQRLRAA